MTDHTVKAYDEELQFIGGRLSEMGGIAEKMLVDAIEALSRLDADLARRTMDRDPKLDLLQREIEEMAVLTIARRQPMANDLRELVAAIHIASDLERVGDLAKNIAKRTTKISGDIRVPRTLIGLKHMADIAALQLKNVLDAYAHRNVAQADDVWRRDADVDAMEDSVFRDLLTFMMEDPRNISFCTHLLFCSKNIERIGDHATNIAETVHYLVTGDPLPVDRPKGGSSGAESASAGVE
ncbi:phosphate signaling complex protein PhoU [Roseiarcaceae bacterium H3SJ34-1]|uniref:phosphate signaling complex protein PhoU n=1 Tax=Terripilifer ovatus TaxID=3032367 RepID=UPI003AB965DF|nr:phosphate signaling complex protein PhoU [Roseiarcaceae bacterium H3SJ34-1]